MFGRECSGDCANDLAKSGVRRALVVTGPNTSALARELIAAMPFDVVVYDRIDQEPTIVMFEDAVSIARKSDVEAVIGVGGGSPLVWQNL